jgi:hypothetical protein
VLQRFERRLGGLVEGAFARVFGGVVQPVEVAAALQREAEDKKMIVGQGRLLVPNDFVVELGQTDAGRLEEYDAPLRRELAAMVSEHAQEQGWSFVGPVQVRFERTEALATGLFRVRSSVPAAAAAAVAAAPRPAAPVAPAATGAAAPTQAAPAAAPAPYLLVPGDGGERRVDLHAEVTRLGRSSEADVRLHDTGVSRLHAELRLLGDEVVLVDLGSTNGTTLNGRRVQEGRLRYGDRIGVGSSSVLFRQGS